MQCREDRFVDIDLCKRMDHAYLDCVRRASEKYKDITFHEFIMSAIQYPYVDYLSDRFQKRCNDAAHYFSIKNRKRTPHVR